MRVRWALAALLVGVCVGCLDQSAWQGKSEEASPEANQPEGPAASGDAASGVLAEDPQAGDEELTPADAAGKETMGGSTRRQTARVGVGKKGRSLDDETGVARIIAQPARSFFAVEQKLVFEVQIPQAMNFFQASNGRMPKSHDEFLEKIIKANSITLPELTPNQKYVYDPKTGRLMVEGPAK